MLHPRKSILQLKIQRLRNNCRHVPPSSYFCAENPIKILKQVQDERWGLEFSHTQAQCGDESPYQIVGQEGLPCCAYMLCACCGPIFTTQNSLVPIWAVFGAKWHRGPISWVVWAVRWPKMLGVRLFLQLSKPHKISKPSPSNCP